MVVYFKIRPSFCNNMVTNFTVAFVQYCIHVHHIIFFHCIYVLIYFDTLVGIGTLLFLVTLINLLVDLLKIQKHFAIIH